MRIKFENTECVKINNATEFDLIYENLRSANYILLNEYLANGYPAFPIYLEHSGIGIGYISQLIGTWSRQPLKVISIPTNTTAN